MSILRRDLPEKVTTAEQALEILRDDSWGRTRTWGVINLRTKTILRKSHTEGCSGADSLDIDEMPIEESVISELKRNLYVQGTPHWGYTDDQELRISKNGEDEAHRIWLRKEEARRKTEGKDS
jgi:hypothetical protein